MLSKVPCHTWVSCIPVMNSGSDLQSSVPSTSSPVPQSSRPPLVSRFISTAHTPLFTPHTTRKPTTPQQILHRHLRRLRHRQLPLRTIRPAHNLADPSLPLLPETAVRASLVAAVVRHAHGVGRGTLGGWFHGSQSWSVRERQVTNSRKVHGHVHVGVDVAGGGWIWRQGVRPEAWRVRGSCERSVVWCRAERIVREGWRGWGGRAGRIRSRAFVRWPCGAWILGV